MTMAICRVRVLPSLSNLKSTVLLSSPFQSSAMRRFFSSQVPSCQFEVILFSLTALMHHFILWNYWFLVIWRLYLYVIINSYLGCDIINYWWVCFIFVFLISLVVVCFSLNQFEFEKSLYMLLVSIEKIHNQALGELFWIGNICGKNEVVSVSVVPKGFLLVLTDMMYGYFSWKIHNKFWYAEHSEVCKVIYVLIALFVRLYLMSWSYTWFRLLCCRINILAWNFGCWISQIYA